MMASSQKITPNDTLIIFDEIQDAPNVLNSLKYFCENKNEYHVACAGSLLGVKLASPSSFPVGKVNFLKINPMTFEEFLIVNGDENLVEYLNSINEIRPIEDAFFNKLSEKLKMYYITGGMPEPVLMWTSQRDVGLVERALYDILMSYERDFAKHPDKKEFPKINLIWNSISSQLARENKKFLYNAVKDGARAREYEDALEWLIQAKLVYKIFRSKKIGLPLKAYDDLSAFKIYVADVGLLRKMSNLSQSAFSEGTRLFTEFKGALLENFVLQGLSSIYDTDLKYWSQTNPSYEVDFILQHDNDLIPVEVKAEKNVKSKSLKIIKELYKNEINLKVRFSLNNLSFDGDVLNIPLFMIDYTKKLIDFAKDKIS